MMTAEDKAAWLSARAGKLTASRMTDAMAFLKNGNPAEARSKLMRELVAERITGLSVPHVLEGLQNTEPTKEAREDISTALGIPQSILWSTEAGGFGGSGVTTEDTFRFYSLTVVPLIKFIVNELNNQVLKDSGYSLQVRESEMDVFQEDETSRSSAMGSLVSSLEKPEEFLITAEILGYDLTEEQKLQIKALGEERKKAAEAMERTDVIIEVLDARLPEASCNPMIRELREHRQRPCLKILNKSDLADPTATKAWLDYYNKQSGIKAVALSCKKPGDAAKVPGLCAALAPHRGTRLKPLRMMIMGIPNVGKSTLMNALLKRRAAAVGDEPAITRNHQSIALNECIVVVKRPHAPSRALCGNALCWG